jgi:hypothetical protein
MPRGILVDGSTIVMVNGKRVNTFWGCDLDYLAEIEGVRAGDVVAFSLARGTTQDAQYIRKAASPTVQELELQRAVKRGELHPSGGGT